MSDDDLGPTLQETLQYLTNAFRDGTPIEHGYGPGKLTIERAPDLVVPSGWLVARDPLISGTVLAFARRVAPGRYPVLLSLADYDERDRRVAFATIQIGTIRPVRWEMATRPGEEMASLGERDIFGYIVDAGTGSFMDQAAARVLDRMSESEFDDFAQLQVAEFFKNGRVPELWLDRTLDPDTGANFVAFSSGLGDDLYASYWGFDTDDQIVCLTTDFNMNLDFAGPAAEQNGSSPL